MSEQLEYLYHFHVVFKPSNSSIDGLYSTTNKIAPNSLDMFKKEMRDRLKKEGDPYTAEQGISITSLTFLHTHEPVDKDNKMTVDLDKLAESMLDYADRDLEHLKDHDWTEAMMSYLNKEHNLEKRLDALTEEKVE